MRCTARWNIVGPSSHQATRSISNQTRTLRVRSCAAVRRYGSDVVIPAAPPDEVTLGPDPGPDPGPDTATSTAHSALADAASSTGAGPDVAMVTWDGGPTCRASAPTAGL